MDFRFSEEQTSLRELAREILEKEVTAERLKEIEAGDDWFDASTWARLAEANLLGLAVPEAQGGVGLGFLELCLLLGEVGRAVAPLPALPALVGAGLPLARFGSEAQRERWLPGLARGESLLTAAFGEAALPVARPVDGGLALEGTLAHVPAVHLAQRVLAPAATPDGRVAVLLDPQADGVTPVRRRTSRGEPLFELTLAGARVADEDVLRAEGIVDWISERLLVGLAATQIGVSERALEITTAFLREREQFGAPLGALPPVQHRCADCYIALDALRWVAWRAAWRLAEDLPARRDAWVAKFWAADAGSRIATATQHLHGGMGVDLDYPIHRHFLWSKALELAHGAATPQLVRLGRDMARTGAQEWA
jgi:alkylation response protein AidB-like acyl-CoA dehydrogenase